MDFDMLCYTQGYFSLGSGLSAVCPLVRRFTICSAKTSPLVQEILNPLPPHYDISTSLTSLNSLSIVQFSLEDIKDLSQASVSAQVDTMNHSLLFDAFEHDPRETARLQSLTLPHAGD